MATLKLTPIKKATLIDLLTNDELNELETLVGISSPHFLELIKYLSWSELRTVGFVFLPKNKELKSIVLAAYAIETLTERALKKNIPIF